MTAHQTIQPEIITRDFRCKQEQLNNNNNNNNNNKGTAKNSHIGHCTHTTESANVKVQNIFHGGNRVAQIVNSEQLQKYIYPRNMVCFRYIIVNTLHKK